MNNQNGSAFRDPANTGNTPGVSVTPPTAAAQEPRTFSLAETVFAWLCLLFGYLFFRVFPLFDHPLGTAVVALLLYAVTLAVLLIEKKKPDGVLPILAFASAVVLSVACFLCGDSLLRFFSAAYAAVLYPFFLMAWNGHRLERGFSDLVFPDFIRALFTCPFASFRAVFSACRGGKKGSGVIGKAVIGLLIAVIPTMIVGSLLSYDEGFRKILGNIFTFTAGDAVSQLFSILFGILLGMYLFGAYLTSADHQQVGKTTAASCRAQEERARILPAITAVAAVLPLLFLYGVFFVSQWNYYVSAFRGVLPDGTVYSEYAREGFFQLCAVAALNFFLTALLLSFLKRREDGRPPVAVTVAATLLLLSTLILIATAVSKMALYIDAYGLTRLRVLSTWFMVVIAVCTLIVAVGLFVKKTKPLPSCLAVAVVLFAALTLSSPDRLIADYNVDRYLDGTLKSVDVEMLGELGDDAIPALLRLADYWDEKNGTDVKTLLKDSSKAELPGEYRLMMFHIAVRLDDDPAPDLFERDLSYFLAEKALKDAGLKED